jgi:2-polyprenyl-3-methyl-5-hydroxy-6-metoxy-1,4-benzoquinol methylase
MGSIDMTNYYTKDGDRPRKNTIENFRENVFPVILQYVKNFNYALDIGCGNGRLAQILSKQFVNVVAIDQCNVFDERFKSNNIAFENVAFEEFQTNHKFDLIILWAVFYMVGEQTTDDFIKTLTKCRNLLSADGIIVLGEDVKYKIGKNPSPKALYDLSQLCQEVGLIELQEFIQQLRVTILNQII